jgi:H+/gluconate symporter-like permease
MDNETKQLVIDLQKIITENRSSFGKNILQSVIIALIVSIPTMIMVGNKMENRIVRMETEQYEIRKKADYNFRMLQSKHPELYFYPLNE